MERGNLGDRQYGVLLRVRLPGKGALSRWSQIKELLKKRGQNCIWGGRTARSRFLLSEGAWCVWGAVVPTLAVLSEGEMGIGGLLLEEVTLSETLHTVALNLTYTFMECTVIGAWFRYWEQAVNVQEMKNRRASKEALGPRPIHGQRVGWQQQKSSIQIRIAF